MSTQQFAMGIPVADERNLITFRLGEQIYGLPIESVERIIPMVTITSIPQVDSSVEGIINVRGKAVPVVNLRRHLGMTALPLQQHTPILLVWIDKLLVGLIVDTVIDMLTLPHQKITRPADIMPTGLGAPPILEGLVHQGRDTVLIFHVNHLFLPEQKQALTQAVASIEMQMEDIVCEEDPAEEEPVEENTAEEELAEEELPGEEQNDEESSAENPDEEASEEEEAES